MWTENQNQVKVCGYSFRITALSFLAWTDLAVCRFLGELTYSVVSGLKGGD